VEEIQDKIEETLVQFKEYKIAKAYILYRQRRANARRLAASLGVKDDLKLPTSALIVLSKRYLLKDEKGRIKETPMKLFRRVARAIAQVDEQYGTSSKDVRKLTQQFYDLMTQGYFLPNSPTLMNAGAPLGQLSACFVLPVHDSIDSIFLTLYHTAKIHQTGGGVGFNFSTLRPTGDVVRTTGGVASGPVSFMRVYDAATQEIKQGGKRRGANMGILNVNHPDILEFITAKSRGGLENFNISVAVTDKFMRAVQSGETIPLVNPRNKEVVQNVPARAIWDLIVAEAWRSGDPGLVFLDTINKSNSNVVPKYGPIEATNPCGELPLYPYESCNLGSINLSKFVKMNKEPHIDWERLEQVVRLAVHFLDNVIDANKFPLQEIETMTKKIRRVGLGVMGWADLLIALNIPYNSQQALDLAAEVMKFITEKARDESVRLGEQRGSFPEFKDSIWPKRGYKTLRNGTVTCIAPTGTISILAGCSPGIEPLFSIVTVRDLEESLGAKLVDINQAFESRAIKEGFYSEELMDKIARDFSIQKIQEIPEEVKRVFVTAHDISPEWHVKMQATFQMYTDNAVSKTVNLPYTATPHDVENVYFLAWKLGCKGITVFRTGSKDKQVFTTCKECEVEE
jgi:ribonucleoside-diphosphate reductase alpha chain